MRNNWHLAVVCKPSLCGHVLPVRHSEGETETENDGFKEDEDASNDDSINIHLLFIWTRMGFMLGTG